MRKYQFGELFNRVFKNELHWLLQTDDDNEITVGEGLDDELIVLNKLGQEGWSVAFQVSFNENSKERHLMLQREILT